MADKRQRMSSAGRSAMLQAPAHAGRRLSHAERAMLATLTLVISAQVVLGPVVFGIAFPYSLAGTEVVVLGAFLASLPLMRYSSIWLLAVPALVLVLVLHLMLLEGATFFTTAGQLLWSSPESVRSELDWAAALDAFRRVLAYLLVFVLSWHVAQSDRPRKVLSGAVAASAALLLLLGVLAPQSSKQVLWFYEIPSYGRGWGSAALHDLLTALFGYYRQYDAGGVPVFLLEKSVSSRPIGPIFNENQYAAGLGVTFPVLLAWIADRLGPGRTGRRVLVLGAAALAGCAVQLLVVGSRGGVLALVVALAAFVAVDRNRALARVALGLGLVIGAAITLLALLSNGGVIGAVFGGRAGVWDQTWGLFLSKPFVGIGLSNFADYKLIVNEAKGGVWLSPHNVYLHVLAEIGLLGLACLALFGMLAWRASRPREPVGSAAYAAGLCASLVYAFVHAALDYSPAMPFNAVILAVVCGLLLAEFRRPRRPRTGSRTFRRGAAGLTVLVTMLLAVTALRFAQVDARAATLEGLVVESLFQPAGAALLRERLTAELSRNEESMERWNGRKRMLLTMAYGNLLLSRNAEDGRLEEASRLLYAYQAIGQPDVHVALTQGAVAARLEALQ